MQTNAETLAAEARSLLETIESLHADRTESQAVARSELAAARRAVRTLSGGTTTMKQIGQTVANQIDALEERVEVAADELSVTRAWKARMKRVVDLMGSDLISGRPPTDALVKPIVMRLIADNGRLKYQDVYDRTRDELAEERLPAIGLALRVRNALEDPAIVDEPNGYRLKASDPTELSGKDNATTSGIPSE